MWSVKRQVMQVCNLHTLILNLSKFPALYDVKGQLNEKKEKKNYWTDMTLIKWHNKIIEMACFYYSFRSVFNFRYNKG